MSQLLLLTKNTIKLDLLEFLIFQQKHYGQPHFQPN